MKNSLLILSLIILWISLTWCQKQENIEACNSINGNCTNTKKYLTWEKLCIDNDGQPTTDELWNDICLFNAHDWCLLKNIEDWNCEFLSDEYNSWEEEYPIWEQICIDYNGQISETDDNSEICIFNDEEFCYLEDLQDWWCDLLPPQPECSKERDPVCWKDWNTYNNRCLLEAAWVEEETEAEITENWCVFW